MSSSNAVTRRPKIDAARWFYLCVLLLGMMLVVVSTTLLFFFSEQHRRRDCFLKKGKESARGFVEKIDSFFLTVFPRRRRRRSIHRRRRRRRQRGFLATRGAETVLQRETYLLKTPGDDELGVVVELTQKVLDGLASVLIARGALR
mgnify:CR=1 FL=1